MHVARELTLNVNILQVFTIDFSEIKFIVNRNLKFGWTEQKCQVMDEICKTKPHVPSLCRGIQKIPRTMISHLERVRQKWAYATATRFSSCCLSQKTVSTACQVSKLQNQFLHNHTGDGILLQAHRGGTRLDGIGGVRKNLKLPFLLQLVSFTVDGEPLYPTECVDRYTSHESVLTHFTPHN